MWPQVAQIKLKKRWLSTGLFRAARRELKTSNVSCENQRKATKNDQFEMRDPWPRDSRLQSSTNSLQSGGEKVVTELRDLDKSETDRRTSETIQQRHYWGSSDFCSLTPVQFVHRPFQCGVDREQTSLIWKLEIQLQTRDVQSKRWSFEFSGGNPVGDEMVSSRFHHIDSLNNDSIFTKITKSATLRFLLSSVATKEVS